MNDNKTQRILTAYLLAVAFAGSGFTTVGTALNVSAGLPVWIAAALTCVACAMMALSTPTAIVGSLALALGAGGMALSHAEDLQAIPIFIAAWQGQQADAALVMNGIRAALVCAAVAFGMLYFLLLYKHGFTGLAIMLLAATLVFSHGMSRTASIPAAVPGLIAGAMAFALADGVQRDGLALRVLIPSALAVALALMVSPVGRVTWQPMEDLANRVRNVFEQYFNFTHERIAYSISEEGYNHGGEVNGQPVAMLGGPANPDPAPVMRVTADGELLLRGTIRSTYTGYSWVDVTPKSRYLYYDLTHRNVRDRVFNLNFGTDSGFSTVTGEVELIDSATSTLFVPGRLERFDMDLSNAVYYNSAGEMFMAREAQAGDRYGVVSLNPVYSEALRQRAIRGEAENDPQYDAILAAHTQLPEGVERGLYDLTLQETATANNAYDRAMAIAGYLRRNMRYKLDVVYPPAGRDFASWFVLESKEGYCSYFATAMAVMGRLAGLPTRYVEGYYARMGPDGTATLTGMDAHAWAEVYFKGLGWVAFDATNGGPGSGAGGSGEGDTEYGYAPGGDDASETPFEDTSDESDGEREDDASTPPEDDDDENDDTPEDDQSDDASEDDQTDLPPDAPPDDPDDAGGERGFPWLLIALPILLLLILAALWVRDRLRKADPAVLCAQSRRAQQGAMIAYRANLTLLAHMGQQPQNGETPDAFVERVCREFDNPDYAEFVRAVSYARYGGRPLRKEHVELGLNAYRAFLKGMRLRERVRFTLSRLFRGLGDFENIP
ncbi:MAG: DUF4129 domain-containing protein [Clostridia bacterium]|nr:DUF4129 domain-containing protein [Clostridia bacterium]